MVSLPLLLTRCVYNFNSCLLSHIYCLFWYWSSMLNICIAFLQQLFSVLLGVSVNVHYDLYIYIYIYTMWYINTTFLYFPWPFLASKQCSLHLLCKLPSNIFLLRREREREIVGERDVRGRWNERRGSFVGLFLAAWPVFLLFRARTALRSCCCSCCSCGY